MTTKAQRQINATMKLETVVTRFGETFERSPEVFWAERKTAHTDLLDGWAWAMEALEDAVAALPRSEAIRAEAITERMKSRNEQLQSAYSFGK